MNRIFGAAPFALAAFALVSISGTPAFASDTACTAMPANIRSIAASADAEDANKALKHVRTGELLCEARNARAAKKKFELAYKALGVAEEQYAELAK